MGTDPRILFGSKDESNARRRKQFLALSPWERLVFYLRDIERNPPASEDRGEARGNFIIRKKDEVRD